MIRTLAWKEYREHRAVWLAVAVLSVLFVRLVFVAIDTTWGIGTTPDNFIVLLVGSVATVSTYGLVCGAMMLAGEHEGVTLGFLDVLSRYRSVLWRTKLRVGLVLTVAQSLVVGIALRFLIPDWTDFDAGGWWLVLLWLILLAVVAVEALVWGLFYSARHRSVLAAAGLAGVTLALLWYVGGLLYLVSPPLAVAARLVLAGGALWSARRTFCQPDLSRILGPEPLSARRAVFWLALRQGRALISGMALAAVVGAVPLAASGWPCWPVITLLIGVACGTATFAPEQGPVTYRFLGNERFPARRIWRWKVGCWLAVGLGITALVGLELTVLATLAWQPGQPEPPGVGLRTDAVWAGASGRDQVSFLFFLLLCLLIGFAFGQVFGILFHKGAVALVVATLASLCALGFWLPTLIVSWPHGGYLLRPLSPFWGFVWGLVQPFTPFLPSAFVLLAGRLAIRPWLAGRLHSGRGLAAPLACLPLDFGNPSEEIRARPLFPWGVNPRLWWP